MPTSWNTVIFKFRLIFATIRCFVEAHWSVFLLLPRINGLPQTPKTYGSLVPTLGRKNQAKFENDCISRSGHRFKITQPNLMILVSFSSVEDALSNDVNKYDILSSQGIKNPLFCFFGGHPVYSVPPKILRRTKTEWFNCCFISFYINFVRNTVSMSKYIIINPQNKFGNSSLTDFISLDIVYPTL